MRLRAPRDDGAVLAVPPLAEAGRLLDANRRLLSRPDVLLLDRSLSGLQQQARRAALDQARAYFQDTGEAFPELASGESLLLAGHQPELFHPGVWVKNFALCGLARQQGVVPLNLVVDNDAPKSTALRMPVWTENVAAGKSNKPTAPHLIQALFDYWHGDIPYEERRVQDETFFAGFADRARARTRTWPFDPMLTSFWKEVSKQSARTVLLGERFASARRSYERCWGCHNWELPLSRLLTTEPAFWFMAHLLANAGEFHTVYNDVVRSYRLRYGMRSRNRPVPDLGRDGDWLEVPLWAWRSDENRRKRLFVRTSSDIIQVRAGSDAWPSVSLRSPAKGLQAMTAAGWKIRTRALTTTLLSRLLLADLFIHGIGGGIYDELSDDIMRRFFRIDPPSFLVLSATLLLPFPRYPADEDTCRRLKHELRDLHWNPQRHLQRDRDAGLQHLVEEKNAWSVRVPTNRAEARTRFRMLRDLTDRLHSALRGHERSLAEALERCQAELPANQVLGRRDIAFCFYPEKMLRDFCVGFLEP